MSAVGNGNRLGNVIDEKVTVRGSVLGEEGTPFVDLIVIKPSCTMCDGRVGGCERRQKKLVLAEGVLDGEGRIGGWAGVETWERFDCKGKFWPTHTANANPERISCGSKVGENMKEHCDYQKVKADRINVRE
jgi:hypothetical protein